MAIPERPKPDPPRDTTGHLAAAMQRDLDRETEESMYQRRVYWYLEGYDEFMQIYKHAGTSFFGSISVMLEPLREKYPDTAWYIEKATPSQRTRILDGEPLAEVRAGL
jgi:hypothetical protein